MKFQKKAAALLRCSPGRRLVIFMLLALALLAFLVFLIEYMIGFLSEASLMDHTISSFPRITEDRITQLESRETSYDQETRIRGELAAHLYERYRDLPRDERLVLVRDAVSALSISLADADGNLIASTDVDTARLLTTAHILSLPPGEVVFRLVMPNVNDDDTEDEIMLNETTEDSGSTVSGSGFIRCPISVDGEQYLIARIDCTPYAELYADQGSWASALERMLSGLDAYAFVFFTGEEEAFDGYPLDSLTKEELSQLEKQVEAVFHDPNIGMTIPIHEQLSSTIRVLKLLNHDCLTATRSFPERGVTVMLAVPFENFMYSTLLNVQVLIAFCAVSLILFTVYAVRRMRLEAPIDDKKARRRHARWIALPGLLPMLVIMGCFFVMLMLLEHRAGTAAVTMSQMEALKYEIDYNKAQEDELREDYPDALLIRANGVCRLLTDHPEYRTREELKELSDIIAADYLMLFDRDGKELIASNAYNGYAVSDDSSEPSFVYRTVLMGWPWIVTEPVEDSVTGQYEYTIASLLTDGDGLADGFLLVADSADSLVESVDRISLENTVNSFATQEGQIVALVDEESGAFLAHSDASMIGNAASRVMNTAVLGLNYEGFSKYDGKTAYISSSDTGDKDLLVITPDQGADLDILHFELVVDFLLAFLVLSVFLFYPVAAGLCADIEYALRTEDQTPPKKNPLLLFPVGYIVFFTALSFMTGYAQRQGIWPAFGFVFSGQWSKGVHLFSLWAALFFLSVALTVVFILHAVLAVVDKQLSQRARTIERLVDSLVTYAGVIFTVGYILTMFGVNTEALLASAGIVSIAVGMGARDLIADILAGLFMILEGSVHVGDIVMVAGWRGCVTDMGIRTMEITDASQDVKIINNSHVSEIINMSRIRTACTMDFNIPRSVPRDQIPALFAGYIDAVVREIPALAGSLELDGITDISPTGYTVRLSYSCNEADREDITSDLHSTMQVLLEEKPAVDKPAAAAAT